VTWYQPVDGNTLREWDGSHVVSECEPINVWTRTIKEAPFSNRLFILYKKDFDDCSKRATIISATVDQRSNEPIIQQHQPAHHNGSVQRPTPDETEKSSSRTQSNQTSISQNRPLLGLHILSIIQRHATYLRKCRSDSFSTWDE